MARFSIFNCFANIEGKMKFFAILYHTEMYPLNVINIEALINN